MTFVRELMQSIKKEIKLIAESKAQKNSCFPVLLPNTLCLNVATLAELFAG